MDNNLSIRITHRAQQDCNPAETEICIGSGVSAPSRIADFTEAEFVPGDATEMAEALSTISATLGTGNTLDEMLHAIDALCSGAQSLEWSDTLCEGERVTHAAAEKACAALGEGWRLPTRPELESILDLTRHDPAVDTDRFPDTKSGAYWTSTECAWASSCAWFVSFDVGSAYDLHRDDSYGFVRAVRSVSAGQ